MLPLYSEFGHRSEPSPSPFHLDNQPFLSEPYPIVTTSSYEQIPVSDGFTSIDPWIGQALAHSDPSTWFGAAPYPVHTQARGRIDSVTSSPAPPIGTGYVPFEHGTSDTVTCNDTGTFLGESLLDPALPYGSSGRLRSRSAPQSSHANGMFGGVEFTSTTNHSSALNSCSELSQLLDSLRSARDQLRPDASGGQMMLDFIIPIVSHVCEILQRLSDGASPIPAQPSEFSLALMAVETAADIYELGPVEAVAALPSLSQADSMVFHVVQMQIFCAGMQVSGTLAEQLRVRLERLHEQLRPSGSIH